MSLGIEAITNKPKNVVQEVEVVSPEMSQAVDSPAVSKVVKTETEQSDARQQDDKKNDPYNVYNKEPSKNTIASSIAELNAKVKPQRTRCEYAYDEETKRISIKVLDDETNEVIHEVPSEESLKLLQKVWELAGIIVDEKR